MSDIAAFVKALDSCPQGRTGWVDFEDICTQVLEHLFVPSLAKPTRQPRTYSGVNRRDAIFPNRNFAPSSDPCTRNWHHFYVELNARMVLFEFKNYDSTPLTHAEVNQTRNYLTNSIGRLGVIICTRDPEPSALTQRNTTFTQDRKVIVFLKPDHLKEMLFMKERGEDPSDLIIDSVEKFYMQHE